MSSTIPVSTSHRESRQSAISTYFEVWNDQDYDRLDAIMVPGFRREGPDASQSTLEEMKEFMRQVHATYADFHIEGHETAYEADHSFVRWTITCALRETGQRLTVSGATLHRYDEARITEELAYWDTAAATTQTGLDSPAHVK